MNYYNFTRDTSLQTFPHINNNLQCIPEKHIIVYQDQSEDIDFAILFVIYLFIFSPTICILCSDEDDYFKDILHGIYTGFVLHYYLNY